MTDRLIDRMAWCLRANRNALQQGRPVSVDVARTTEAVLHEYDIGRRQDAEDAQTVMARIADDNA